MSNDQGSKKMHAPGSFVIAVIFLAWCAIVYVTQWAALANNWYVK